MNDTRQWLRDMDFPEHLFPSILRAGWAWSQWPLDRPWWDDRLDTEIMKTIPCQIYVDLARTVDVPDMEKWQRIETHNYGQLPHTRLIFRRK